MTLTQLLVMAGLQCINNKGGRFLDGNCISIFVVIDVIKRKENMFLNKIISVCFFRNDI